MDNGTLQDKTLTAAAPTGLDPAANDRGLSESANNRYKQRGGGGSDAAAPASAISPSEDGGSTSGVQVPAQTAAGGSLPPSPPAAPVSETRCKTWREVIDEMPPGFKGLYGLVLFCREGGSCSTALRVRAFLCSLYNGKAARTVDLSEVQGFDPTRRRDFADVILNLGCGTGLYDSHIRKAFADLGMEWWFDKGFPKRRARW